jgi:hypothetical protein
LLNFNTDYTYNHTKFSGRFPTRLKEIQVVAIDKSNPAYSFVKSAASELRAIGKESGFRTTVWSEQLQAPLSASPSMYSLISASTSNKDPWIQDGSLHIDSGTVLATPILRNPGAHANITTASGQAAGLQVEGTEYYIDGGNTFIGERHGERIAIIGKMALKKNHASDSDSPPSDATTRSNKAFLEKCKRKAAKAVSSALCVRLKNLLQLSQPDYHLDMAIRPISNTHVLHEEPAKSQQHLQKAIDIIKPLGKYSQVDLLEGLKKDTEAYYAKKVTKYVESDVTRQELRKHGFVPLPIAGSIGNDQKSTFVARCNAFTHLNDQGDLVYITNASPYSHIKHPQNKQPLLDWLFQQDLQNILEQARKSGETDVPKLDSVHFIKAGKHSSNPQLNGIQEALAAGGGIHCLGTEQPA